MQEKECILVVDDERSNLNVISDLLKEKYTILLAKNGAKALERAVRQQPELILLDIMMPEMDGYQVLLELKNNEATKAIPVIFISALGEADDEEKGLLLGAVDYIVKPFHPAIVRARIDNQLKIVRQRKLLENIALIDGLTEIPNRRNFEQLYENEWKRALRDKNDIAVGILDIDYFKQYNDTYGHARGDEVLKTIAQTIVFNLKRPADFAARLGGEEFVILLPDTDAKGARELAEMIQKTIEKLNIPHTASKITDCVTASIGGISTQPTRDITKLQALELADTMLYKAKSSGRNRVEWHAHGNSGQ